MTGKKRAIRSLHRDSLVAKVPGLCPDASSGNATSLYCRAVIVHISQEMTHLEINFHSNYNQITMIRNLICLCVFFSIIGCSHNPKDNILQENENKFIKVEITDHYLKEILHDYSKLYDSDSYNLRGKGVLMTRIISNHDTTKYYVNLFPHKDFFDYWMEDKNFVLYDTIGGRIVILATKQESFYKFPNIKAESDTILNRFDYKSRPYIIEIWLVEYTRVDTLISRNVYYQDPF